MNKLTILGSGTSTGVPILGCLCQVCQSNDVRNKRSRTSALIRSATGKSILIDTPPDLRTQLLRSKIAHVDAVIITHDHADHTHGIDDLRPFGFRSPSPLPVFTNEATSEALKKKFSYIFDRGSYFKDRQILGGGIPLLDLNPVAPGLITILDEEVELYSLPHGHEDTLGLRHRGMAYLTDCREIPDQTLNRLSDAQLEILVIDCLRPTPHQTHLHLDLSLRYIEQIRPKTAVLTHLGHEWDHLDLIDQIRKRGVKNTFPALDGMEFHYS